MSDSEGPAASRRKDAVPFDRHAQLPGLGDVPLSIGNVSRMFHVSRLTLHVYERLGLIKRRNRSGSNLVYTWVDCDRLAFMIKARRAGLTVFRLAPVIRGANPKASASSVKAARARCMELIEQLDRQRQALRDALAELRHIDELLSKRLPVADNGAPPDNRDAL